MIHLFYIILCKVHTLRCIEHWNNWRLKTLGTVFTQVRPWWARTTFLCMCLSLPYLRTYNTCATTINPNILTKMPGCTTSHVRFYFNDIYASRIKYNFIGIMSTKASCTNCDVTCYCYTEYKEIYIPLHHSIEEEPLSKFTRLQFCNGPKWYTASCSPWWPLPFDQCTAYFTMWYGLILCL